ncbi:MAG: tetratricopeptide repeat protein [Rhodospirillaceae bacterium]|nr:tetratricopeptide repeat protein [Rhodospirillaceae bacterium]MDD9916682.1 tetratricopeptide repeat protein [Rhodospirillaceae bacterium]
MSVFYQTHRLALSAVTIALLIFGAIGSVEADYKTGERAVMMGDYPTALKNFREAAAQGHPKAQFELGLMYEQGDGVKRDFAEAAKWYRKALANGHELAARALRRVTPFGVAENSQNAATAPVSRRKTEVPDGTLTVQRGGLTSEPVSPSAGYSKKFEALHLRPLSESPLILPDLKAKIKDLPPPYLYELARRTFDIDKREAFVWFLTGYLRAAYDASKCTDRTAGQGILQLPNLAPRVSRALFADKAYAKKIMKEALERERAFPEDSNPSWICFHGMKAMVAAM